MSIVSIWRGDSCRTQRARMPHIFVIGDSHAVSYTAMLMRFAMDTGAEVRAYANGGCPFLSLQLSREAGNCPRNTKAAVADILVRAREGDVLFLPSLRLNRLSDQNTRRDETAAWQATIGPPAVAGRQLAVAQAIEALKPFERIGMRIVFDAPKPVFRASPFRCSDWFNAQNAFCVDGLSMDRAELERYRAPTLEALERIASKVGGVSVWDTFPILCPGEKCDASIDGHPLFYDGDHISGYANRLLLPYFEQEIESVSATPVPNAAAQ